MSYVIQNFYYPTNSLRSTTSSRAAIIVRNFGLIHALFSNSTKVFNMLATTGKSPRFSHLVTDLYFNAFAKAVFRKPSFMKYTPIGTNFPLSAQYNALYGINNLLSTKKSIKIFLPLPNNYFKMPYFEGYRVAITPISKKPLSYAVYKFLRLTLSMWIYWPKKYKITANFTLIHSSWHLLKFLNKYFFKVYNI